MNQGKKKTVIKFIFVIAILAAIIYTFRDSAGPIFEQLKKTSPPILVVICLLSVCYELVEGWITYSFAKNYNPDIRYAEGVESAFYCSFYRVATLGSGAGIAAIYYFHEKGIEYSESTGMYMIEYVVHKISIALLSLVLLIFNFTFLRDNYNDYIWLLVIGYGITIVIAFFLLLFCCSKKFHKFILWLMEKINRATKGKLENQLGKVYEYCEILEEASRKLLDDKKLLVLSVFKNFLKFAFWYSIPFFILGKAAGMTLPQVMAVVSLAVMLAAVIPAPAGIGSTEFVFTMLFAVMAGTGMAGSASLLYRFATFVVPFLIGAVVALNHQKKKRRQGR